MCKNQLNKLDEVLSMCKYLIKEMESEEEINGKAYVHYKSWHETYTDLVDTEYMNGITLEKEIALCYNGDTVIF